MYLCCLLPLRDIIIFLLLWHDICAESAVKPQAAKQPDVNTSVLMRSQWLAARSVGH